VIAEPTSPSTPEIVSNQPYEIAATPNETATASSLPAQFEVYNFS